MINLNKKRMEELSQEQIGFVFIHGAGLESQIWEHVVLGLENPCLLVNFPHREGLNKLRQRLTLEDYITHINKQIQAWGVKKFVIVAHSLGGILALRIANDMSDRVVGFVAIGAIIPNNGGSFLSIMPFAKRVLMKVILRMLGTKPPDTAIRQGICNDLSADQAAMVARNFVPESIRLYFDEVKSVVPNVPKLYLKLENDKELSPSQQDKMISNLAPDYIESLDTGHLPMLSKPNELRRALSTFLSHLELRYE
jgi:pimeloyl-ACP methyl ester carboxylesterase